MEFKSDPLTNEILQLALQAKELTDQINEMKVQKGNLFSATGNRKLTKAYQKTKKVSVLLMETSFTIDPQSRTFPTQPRIELEKVETTESMETLE